MGIKVQYGQDLLPDRFWEKVFPEPNTGCWLWGGAWCSEGYGSFRMGGKTVKVHRLSFITLGSLIPSGLQLDHLCRQRSCVNPDHLEPVTARENVRRGNGPAGINSRKTECDFGHPFDVDNTRYDPDGKRNCKKCDARRTRDYLERKWE